MVQRVLCGLSSPGQWFLVRLGGVGEFLLLSKTTEEHCQATLFKVMVMLSLATTLDLCQPYALERSLGF